MLSCVPGGVGESAVNLTMVVILGGGIECEEGGRYAPLVGASYGEHMMVAAGDGVRGSGSCSASQQLSAHQGLFTVLALQLWGNCGDDFLDEALSVCRGI